MLPTFFPSIHHPLHCHAWPGSSTLDADLGLSNQSAPQTQSPITVVANSPPANQREGGQPPAIESWREQTLPSEVVPATLTANHIHHIHREIDDHDVNAVPNKLPERQTISSLLDLQQANN